jgi:uncharacterized protein
MTNVHSIWRVPKSMQVVLKRFRGCGWLGCIGNMMLLTVATSFRTASAWWTVSSSSSHPHRRHVAVVVASLKSSRKGSRPLTTKMKMSFLDDVSTNMQRAFSSLSSSSSSSSKYYTIGITGSSGLVGTAIVDELERKKTLYGKSIRIVQFKRTKNNLDNDTDESFSLFPKSNDDDNDNLDKILKTTAEWNPTASSVVDPNVLTQLDAIIHLAGENVATGLGPLGFLGIRPWTLEKKAAIVNSRVEPTERLANAIATMDAKVRPISFLVASGIGIYGNDFYYDNDNKEKDAGVDETYNVQSTRGFLADISRQWEAATAAAAVSSSSSSLVSSSHRVVNCRFGVVLSRYGGALGKLYPIFWLGGGGRVGSGQQYFTFISARDAARALVHTLETPSLSGPLNVCAPVPCTNDEFTSALGTALQRPTILPLPGFVVSLVFGEMGEEMLLGGVKAIPTKLLKSGFQFQHETISKAIQSALEEKI